MITPGAPDVLALSKPIAWWPAIGALGLVLADGHVPTLLMVASGGVLSAIATLLDVTARRAHARSRAARDHAAGLAPRSIPSRLGCHPPGLRQGIVPTWPAGGRQCPSSTGRP